MGSDPRVFPPTGGSDLPETARDRARRCDFLHRWLRASPLSRAGLPRHDCGVDLVAISVSHRTAPLHIRERLALTADGAAQLTRELVAARGVEEAVVLCTRHRTELYLATRDPAAARRAALGALGRLADEGDLLGHVQVLRAAQVSRHLFAVAAGLDAMVPDAAEIQGEVRRALERARMAGSAGAVCGRLFGDALWCGGRVRSRTGLADHHPGADDGERRAHSSAAVALVAEAQQRFETWLAGYGAAPAVAILHEHAEMIVARVLAENERRWESFAEVDRERVAILARTIARRLLDEPTRRLRADGEVRASAALELFGLAGAHEDEPPAAVSLQRGRAGR
jgi:glutamyl-tRNA reductase